MNTHETVAQPPAKPVVANEITTLTEQETTQLLKDLKITVESFKVLYSQKRPALCHALEVVLDYCQKQRTDTFATRDLTRNYGTQTIRFLKQGVGIVMTGYWAEDHRLYWKRQRDNPEVFLLNTSSTMTFMRQIIDLIASQNDIVMFPVTFQVQRADNDKKKRRPCTCRVVRR